MTLNKRIFVTGSSGFIGFHLCKLLLNQGFRVHGYDGMTDYYDVTLKEKRLSILNTQSNFSFTEGMLEDSDLVNSEFQKFKADIVVHLAAQAGVRYSLENPRAYIDSNIIGTFNIMEASRLNNIEHLLMASTSSVYGANEKMPFVESDKADTQLTIYSATKKANESMAHSNAYLYKIPTTMFRFFTVYGPWGRPDMALFMFTKGILDNEKIDIYNNGEMHRDFTYIDDLVNGIRLLFEAVPETGNAVCDTDNISNVAPFRVVNIGNSDKVKLIDFIEIIESELGQKAQRNMMPMQVGDVKDTFADVSLLKSLTGFTPKTNIKKGISEFISWYRDYYNV